MRIGFYKNSKTLFGGLIRFQQRRWDIPERYSRYSHVEIVFPDGQSFSASEIDGGVRFKNIEFKTENWDFIDLDISKKDLRTIENFCRKQAGNKYGKVGIFFAQILNMNIKKEGTWFCSEIVTRALQEAGMCCTLNSLFTKPAELAMYLERYHIIKE